MVDRACGALPGLLASVPPCHPFWLFILDEESKEALSVFVLNEYSI